MQTIPKIIHRVHMGPPNDFAEYCWQSSKNKNLEWDHITHDDSDLSKFPMVGEFLDRSDCFAYKSDLMRLEILYNYGGIYLDTDVEILQSLDPFLQYTYPFAAWESGDTIGSAVIGSPPKNEQILEIIIYCLGSIIIESENKKIEYSGKLRMFSPSAITKLWKDNEAVRLLNSQSFYPYHWTEKNIIKKMPIDNPDTFGIHHWSGSWVK